jgi:hypothetical protein
MKLNKKFIAAPADVIRGMTDLATPVTIFVDEKCDLKGSVAKVDLYEAWRDWCKKTGNHAGSIQEFSRDLNAAFPRKLKPVRPRVGEKRPHEWRGIKMKNMVVPVHIGPRDHASSRPVLPPRRLGHRPAAPLAGPEPQPAGPGRAALVGL